MNILKLCIFSAAMISTGFGYAQQDNGKKDIEKLCGCFSVDYKYAETFSPDAAYKFHDREELSSTELVLPVDNSNGKIVLQHLLVMDSNMVIKHWREEWSYESPVLFHYTGNKTWEKQQLSADAVKGRWTQTVWEVSDEPRYQGMSRWIENDGKTYWESTADAPLPRREYSVRSDYNILKRHNRIVLTADGYVHEQDNDKVIRDGKTEKLVAQEKGYNTYTRIKDSECAVAREWWKKNGAFWGVVRDQWEQYVAKTEKVALKSKVDDRRLDEYLTSLWQDWSKKKISQEQLPGRVKEVLSRFL